MSVVSDPVALAAVLGTGFAYWGGASEWRRHTGRRMVTRSSALFFGSGLVVTAVAVASPLDVLADKTLTAHMVQHVLLLSVAGPLLALGAPLPTLLWALPPSWRPPALSVRRRLLTHHDRHFTIWVIALLALQAAVMWIWHLPDAYDAAIANNAVHACEHLSFLLVSTAAWWSVVTGRRSRRGAASLAALVGSVPGIALGSAMVLAPNPWYPLYVHAGNRGAALVDQQVAGVVMWAFGGMATVVIGASLFKSWLSRAEMAEPVVAAPSRAVPSLVEAPR
ncbi:MAG TPA: cytochrome c oxidase assembly protein [Acidimicrobiales bacterium]|jgi:cytochrome c oxidase assembly factor CtaG|nr:cytochrome c oxidase assembly protein [Acidimicrobiales bacterium]